MDICDQDEYNGNVFHQLNGDQFYADEEGNTSENTEEEQSYDSSGTVS